jgi:hypothetical protein
MKLSTAQRYHRAWRKTGRHFALRYEAITIARKKIPGLKHKVALAVAYLKRMTLEEALVYLGKPWAWRTFVTGDWETLWSPPSKKINTIYHTNDTREVVDGDHPGLQDPMVWEIIGLEIFPKLKQQAIRSRYRRRVHNILRIA